MFVGVPTEGVRPMTSQPATLQYPLDSPHHPHQPLQQYSRVAAVALYARLAALSIKWLNAQRWQRDSRLK